MPKAPLRILLDRNLRDHALRALPAAREQTIRWGNREHTARIFGIKGKPLPSLPNEKWLYDQVQCLPTIASLAREGQIALFTCAELDVEEMRGSMLYQNRLGDIFQGVQIEKLPSAVERTFFHQTINFREYIHGDSVAAFSDKFLLPLDEKQLVPLIEQHMEVPQFDLSNLRNVSRFRELCKGLNTGDLRRDAFHLWTAEVHGLDYFLTADRKFIRAMTETKRISLPVPPICPAQLLEIVGVPNLDALPLAPGEYQDAIDSLFAAEPVVPRWKQQAGLLYRRARIALFRLWRVVARSLC